MRMFFSKDNSLIIVCLISELEAFAFLNITCTLYLFNLIGVIGLITSVSIFFMAFNLFKSYDENPAPPTETNKLIKTGVFAYTRNPIYLAFIFFHLSMFLLFENVMYFLSSVGQAIWLHNWVVLKEEEYLESKMQSEYIRYKDSVRRWMFF